MFGRKENPTKRGPLCRRATRYFLARRDLFMACC